MKHSGFWMMRPDKTDFHRHVYLPMVNECVTTLGFIQDKTDYRGAWFKNVEEPHQFEPDCTLLAITPDSYQTSTQAMRAACLFYREATEKRPVLPPTRDGKGNLTYALTTIERSEALELLNSLCLKIYKDSKTFFIHLNDKSGSDRVPVTFQSEDELLTFVLANEHLFSTGDDS